MCKDWKENLKFMLQDPQCMTEILDNTKPYVYCFFLYIHI